MTCAPRREGKFHLHDHQQVRLVTLHRDNVAVADLALHGKALSLEEGLQRRIECGLDRTACRNSCRLIGHDG
jgi:hypothetical protein